MKPITTRAQHRAAKRWLEKLIDSNPARTSTAMRELKRVSSQIETYERKKYPQWFSRRAPDYLHHIAGASVSAMFMEAAIAVKDKRKQAALYKRTLDHLEKAIDKLAAYKPKP